MDNPIKIIQSNTRGITHKLFDLKCMVSEQDPDIVCTNETMLSGNNTIKTNGFSTYNLNRASQGGGECF